MKSCTAPTYQLLTNSCYLLHIIRFPICIGFETEKLPIGCFAFTTRALELNDPPLSRQSTVLTLLSEM